MKRTSIVGPTLFYSTSINNQYAKLKSYITTGSDLDRPIKRSLQDRLDDIVNLEAFGALGDGNNDDTISFQRAIDQLFLNQATEGTESSRVTLYVPAGVYRLTSTIFIPPFATIVGEGKEKFRFIHFNMAAAIDPGSVSNVEYKK